MLLPEGLILLRIRGSYRTRQIVGMVFAMGVLPAVKD
jgi:hypothetical protein